jgi:hypothetical protein
MPAAGRSSSAGGLLLAAASVALAAAAASGQPAATQTQDDELTRYELLAPDRQAFRIVYDVTATTPGARYYFNPIRKGSEATDERVIDLATGKPLAFHVVSGEQARGDGFATAALDTQYIRVTLADKVPENGERRLRIDKTYRDTASYYREGDTIVFDRSLGIRRNRVTLPAGYELVACNVPAQVLADEAGRLVVSLVNERSAPERLLVKARQLPAGRTSPTASPATGASKTATTESVQAPTLAQSAAQPIDDRASQDREIVYFLQPPETHAFDLFHDYTESRPGTDKYLNIVRAGSRVSNPSARDLDTGAPLAVETLRGPAIAAAGIDVGDAAGGDTEVVVVRFPKVQPSTTIRLRITETYADPSRYGLVGDTLVWRRSFGRPRNAVVLPAGWYLTASSVPAAVRLTDDGRVRLDFVNGRPDALDVLLRAARRAPRAR